MRVVMVNGEPWWVAKDVCDVLGIMDARKSVGLLDEDERNTVPVTDALGRQQETFVVNEPGLYSLILRSRKPEAKAFKRWITHEVLPTLRKTGRYELPNRKSTEDEAMKRERLAVMRMNAQARLAKVVLDAAQKFRDQISPVALESLLFAAVNIAAGRELLQPPAKERLYSATEIAEEAGVSANLVGRVANQYGLKTPEYGEFVLDKSPYSDKQVSAFPYNARGKAKLLELLGLQTDEPLRH
ncbi:MAG: Bro-N domain-containing protein [Alicyclobacillus mali]|uniref:BRO-N domain-containing protein n=1 Tax=Alicyclobacillus mali (ex Roth et al. 2021) TaxID=1123961 RepID=UPI0023EFD655|nr:Bro-N domain-containing protein [Alicyclobacillus mali (ex Roth et al. 2021)]MCL6488423.1 Bro-N domain-containing protein [Alicyclobacillus mali (ex Roth et al. 2021)]